MIAARRRVTTLPWRHEQGPVRSEPWQNVAVMAHWSASHQVSRSVERFLQELLDNGYFCALVSASPDPRPLTTDDPDLLGRVSVIRRPNLGYDFGSWSAYLHLHPHVRSASRVLLVNDSLVGPFSSLQEILDGFAECPTDICGMVGTTQGRPHLQSHVLGYKDGVLDDRALRRFWEDVRVERRKKAVIRHYEIGLSRLADKEGLMVAAHYPWTWATARGQNPTSLGWRRLIALGMPFVKRELVRTPPPEVLDASDIPHVVRSRWGEDVHAWL